MIKAHTLHYNATIRDALIKLNEVESAAINIFVVNEAFQVLGSLTDGDIRRHLIKFGDLSAPVTEAMNKNFERINKDYTLAELDKFRKKKIELVPLVDNDDRLLDLVDLSKIRSILPVDALIMAGGEGRRLQPFTNTIPKPLLRVGDKPILEHNVDRLISFGIKNFFLSIRYLGQQIVDYFGDGSEKGIKIEYLWEKEPLGTVGALRTVSRREHSSVLVMNSDLLTDIDFEDFYRAYEESGADFSVASVPYQVSIPYAVLETQNNMVLSLEEKPTFNYYSSAGIYLLNADLIDLIPPNCSFNATDLIEVLITKGKRVSSFPILGYWLDIGRPEDYMKAIKDIKHLEL